MKNIIPTLIKLVLIILFIQNIGGWNFVQKTFKSSTENTPTPQQLRQIEKFTAEKIKLAEKKISQNLIYSPDEYFNDLSAIDDYAKSFGLKNQWFNQHVPYLQNIVQKQVPENVSYHQISEAANRYKEKLRDERTNGQTIERFDLNTVVPEIAKSLWQLYLQNFFLGIALLLVWFYQGKRTLVIRNPFSFLLAVTVYPVIIGASWYQGLRSVGREVYGEAIARKFKYRIFDLLAEDEITTIKQFVDGAITRNHLKTKLSQGRTAKRSLATAFLVTMILVIVPQQLAKSLDHHQVKVQIEIVDKTCPEIKSDTGQDDSRVSFELVEIFFSEPWLRLLGIISAEVVRKIAKMINKIDHIPWGGYYLFLTEIFNNLTIKGYYHEIFYFNISIVLQPVGVGSKF